MPFSPTRNPGVESAWTANSAVIVENAVPIRIDRPSRARAPATLSSSDASDVSAAAPPTNPKCWFGVSIAGSLPASATSTTGAIETTSATAMTIRVRDIAPGDRQRPREIETGGRSGLDQYLTSLYCPAPERGG